MKKYLIVCSSVIAIVLAACLGYIVCFQPKDPHRSRFLERQIATLDLQDPAWDVPASPKTLEKINEILRQPFRFIGQGLQCTAYASHDGKYVLKFLLQKPLVVKPRFEQLPDFFPFSLLKKYKVNMRQERKQKLFSAFLMAYKEIPELTGTLFVHLNPTKGQFIQPLIIDTKSSPVYIDADATQFILQRRAKLLKPTLIELMWKGNVDQAKARIDQVFMLLFNSAKKQIIDTDQGLIKSNNVGLLKNCAIYIDTGKLTKSSEKISKKAFVKDLERLEPLHRWLQSYYPELASYFEERQKQVIASY